MTQNELRHFGIPGMRWGVRRGRNTHAPKPKKLKAKDLSDDEMKKKIARIQLERQYTQVTKPNVARGKKIVAGIILGMATMRATKFLNMAADKGAIAAGKAATELFLKARNSLIPNI